MTISEIWKFISENPLGSGVATAIILGAGAWLWKRSQDVRDSRVIYTFLLQSSSKTDWDFRTTHAISAATKMPEDRVAELCHKHPKIRRNERELQSWRIDVA